MIKDIKEWESAVDAYIDSLDRFHDTITKEDFDALVAARQKMLKAFGLDTESSKECKLIVKVFVRDTNI
jgi:hypothetical protein